MDKIRPLSVGSIAYRIWARCRVKQHVHSIEQHLAPLQATSKMDPEVLRLVLEGECLEWLWITEKHLTALIAQLVFTFWKGQVSLSLYKSFTRWLSLGGAIHSELLQAELWGRTPAAAAALKGMPNEHSVKKHVEVLGYYLGDKVHEHPKKQVRSNKIKQSALQISQLRYLGLSGRISVISRAAGWGQDITNKGPFTVARTFQICFWT